MNEIYWLTRLDGISSFLAVLICMSGITIFISSIFWILSFSDDNKKINLACSKIWKLFVFIFFACFTINIFIPNTKDALMIWGIGGTIDYIKSNDKSKQLPDKCIDALDKFVEEYITENRKYD